MRCRRCLQTWFGQCWPKAPTGQASPDDMWAAAAVSAPPANGIAPSDVVSALANFGDQAAFALPDGAETVTRQDASTPVPMPPFYHRSSGALHARLVQLRRVTCMLALERGTALAPSCTDWAEPILRACEVLYRSAWLQG